jgi:hypothetical protein
MPSKPVIEFRSPTVRPADPVAVEKFLKGEGGAQAAPALAVSEASPGAIEYDIRPQRRTKHARKDGRALHRVTVYLPVDLSQRMARHCAETENTLSEFMTELVRAHLDGVSR